MIKTWPILSVSLVRDDDAAVRKVARRILATSDPLAAIAEAEHVLQGDLNR